MMVYKLDDSGNCLTCGHTAEDRKMHINALHADLSALIEMKRILLERLALLERVAEAAREILANGYDQGRRITLRAALSALNPLEEKER